MLIYQASRYNEEKMEINTWFLIILALLKKYADVWDGIKNEIKAMNGGKEKDYRIDYMKIKFNSDDDLLLNKPLKFHVVTIIIRSFLEEGGKLYPQVFLDDALYEL